MAILVNEVEFQFLSQICLENFTLVLCLIFLLVLVQLFSKPITCT